MATQELVTPEVPTSKVDVVNGFNARKSMDRGELKTLAQTIKETGPRPARHRPRR
jgi:hypothetical protein